ncbi:hypothetical protein LSAT2_031795 [Lamellibrachia satsuma]|nr:hypothetical protein LSAT2_031795 [Lamellibrachia satsuma]
MKERYADKTDPKDMQITETGPFTMTLWPTMTLLSCACKRFILLPLRGKTKISKRRALVLLLVLGTFIIYQQQYKVEKYILKTMKTKTLATHKGANQEPRRTIDKLPPMPPVDSAKLKGYHEKDILKTMKTKTLTTHKGANQEPRRTTDKLPPMPPVDRAKLKGYRRVKDECMEYGKAGRINRSVLLGVLGDNTLVNEGDITLITQMTSSRSDKLYRLTVRWSECSANYSAAFPARAQHQCARMNLRHETSPSPRLFDIRPIYRPADNKLDIAAVDRDLYRLHIQLVVRSGDRRPNKLSACSIQQIGFC